MQKIKICQLCAVDFTVKKLLLPLIIRLRDNGYEVHVVCSEGPYGESIRQENITLETIQIPRNIKPFLIIKSTFQLYIYFKKSSFDILHVHTPLAAFIGRLAGYLAGVKIIIYTAHGFYFHERMNIVKRILIQAIEKYLSRITDIIFIQSNEDYEYALNHKFGLKEKIIKIGNGINLSKFKNPDTYKLNSDKISKQRLVIGTCSRLNVEKGIRELVRVSRRMLEEGLLVSFLFIFATNASDKNSDVNDLIINLKKDFPEYVTIVFDVDFVQNYLAKMDIFILLSHREGLPRSIIEAIAMGLPILATRIRGSRELIIDGVNGFLVDVGDEQAIYDRLLKLIIDDKLRLDFAKSNCSLRESYNEELILEIQQDVIKKLVKNYDKF